MIAQLFLILLSCFFGLTLVHTAYAQEKNLIPNPNFEQYKKLPDKDGCFNDYVEGWHNLNGKKGYPNGTPDYLHKQGKNEGRTSTAYFAHVEPQEGEAMMGVIVIPKRPFYEYVCAPLIEPLEKNSDYELSFYINNGEPKYCKCSGRAFGIYLSEALPYQQESERIKAKPQFLVEDNFHTREWQQIRFQFTADKPYTHLTLGYFAPFNEMNMKDITGGSSDCIYFFVDNFMLKKIPKRKENGLTILNLPQGMENISSPFPIAAKIPKQEKEPAKETPTLSVNIQVKDKKTAQPLSAQVTVVDLLSKQEVTQFTTNPKQSSYSFTVPNPTQRYGIFAKAQGYAEASESIEPQKLTQNLTLEKTLLLSPLQKGETIILKNIYFETAKADLRLEAYVELEKLWQLMQDNPKLVIEIAGHTDSEGEDYKNLELSRRRAEAVVNYLKNRKIDTSRIKSVGFGETKPIATNDTPEGRQQNRRVEFKILDN